MFRSLIRNAMVITALPIPDASTAKKEERNPTRYIDSDHPTIVNAARIITAGGYEVRNKAVHLHNFVRARARCGWEPVFCDQKASEVLAAGIGFC